MTKAKEVEPLTKEEAISFLTQIVISDLGSYATKVEAIKTLVMMGHFGNAGKV